jgi:hypothetical protein
MGNNNEIRQRMETCRNVLLALVWVAAIAGMIGGLVMINNSYLAPYGIALLIVSIIGGIIGHFLVNEVLAIPFILLNNGDYLAAIVPEGKIIKSAVSSDVPVGETIKEFEVIESTILVKKPDENSGFVLNIDKGAIIEIIKTEGTWSFVRRGSIEGWCKSSCLKGKP